MLLINFSFTYYYKCYQYMYYLYIITVLFLDMHLPFKVKTCIDTSYSKRSTTPVYSEISSIKYSLNESFNIITNNIEGYNISDNKVMKNELQVVIILNNFYIMIYIIYYTLFIF